MHCTAIPVQCSLCEWCVAYTGNQPHRGNRVGWVALVSSWHWKHWKQWSWHWKKKRKLSLECCLLHTAQLSLERCLVQHKPRFSTSQKQGSSLKSWAHRQWLSEHVVDKQCSSVPTKYLVHQHQQSWLQEICIWNSLTQICAKNFGKQVSAKQAVKDALMNKKWPEKLRRYAPTKREETRWKNVQTLQTRLCYFFSSAVLIF